MARMFVALAVPDAVKEALAAVEAELGPQIAARSLRFTPRAKMHVTLRFLGDVADEVQGPLARALEETARGFGAIDLVAERLGCFPDLRFPRVVWGWVHDAAGRLPTLRDRICAALAPLSGEPVEESFVGHVTLARTHRIGRREADLVAAFVASAVARRFGTWVAKEVELVESRGGNYVTRSVVAL